MATAQEPKGDNEGVSTKASSNSRDSSLLAQIERDVLDRSVPLSDVLLKCVALSGHSGSSELRDWAKSELNGYTSIDNVPEYRVVSGSLYLTHVNLGGYNPMPQRMSPLQLPENIREYVKEEIALTESVSELEAFARQDKSLAIVRPPFDDLAELLTKHGWKNGSIPNIQRIGSIHLQLEPVTIAGVVSRIRTALTVFISELRAHMPADQEIPSAADTNQALAAAVPGIVSVTANTGSTVNLNQGSGNAIANVPTSAPADPPGRRAWVVTGWILAFLVAVIGTYAGLGQWLNWPAPWK